MNPLDIIKQYANILIAIIIIAVTFYSASLFYNHKIDKINKDYTNYRTTTEKNIAEQKISILSQQNKLKEENLALNNQLKDLENEKFKIYSDLQNANNSLKSAISNGSKRLYINASCPESGHNTSGETKTVDASSMDDGKTSKAVIDSRDAESIITITSKGDTYKNQLEALQDWVSKLVLENNK